MGRNSAQLYCCACIQKAKWIACPWSNLERQIYTEENIQYFNSECIIVKDSSNYCIQSFIKISSNGMFCVLLIFEASPKEVKWLSFLCATQHTSVNSISNWSWKKIGQGLCTWNEVHIAIKYFSKESILKFKNNTKRLTTVICKFDFLQWCLIYAKLVWEHIWNQFT